MRDAREMREMTDAFRRTLKDRPAAGVVTAVVDLDAESDRSDVWAWTVDMSPVHLAALAEALLERAGQRFAAMPMDDDLLKCLRGIEAARAALDFTEPEYQA